MRVLACSQGPCAWLPCGCGSSARQAYGDDENDASTQLYWRRNDWVGCRVQPMLSGSSRWEPRKVETGGWNVNPSKAPRALNHRPRITRFCINVDSIVLWPSER